jgi:hypothetical protein
MNSKQRRHNRVFCHKVTLSISATEYGIWWSDFDKRVDDALQWLRRNSKAKNYIVLDPGFRFGSQTILFRDGPLATAFALKWL